MLHYSTTLKANARHLRSHLTDTEQKLWFHLRRKNLLDVQFYRQRPIGHYIVDFYAPSTKLVIEIDGGQHFETLHQQKDRTRDLFLTHNGLKVLRFDNLQVLQSTQEVLEVIYNTLQERLSLLL
jgi:very-short-patch-repair endonuclease